MKTKCTNCNIEVYDMNKHKKSKIHSMVVNAGGKCITPGCNNRIYVYYCLECIGKKDVWSMSFYKI